MATRVMIVYENTAIDHIASVEELILAREQLRTIDNGFQDLKLNTPEWVLNKLSEIDTEINVRVKGALQQRLRMAEARRSALRTRDEKRAELDAEIKDIKERLQ